MRMFVLATRAHMHTTHTHTNAYTRPLWDTTHTHVRLHISTIVVEKKQRVWRNNMLNVLKKYAVLFSWSLCPPWTEYVCMYACIHVSMWTCARVWSSCDNLYNTLPMYMSRSVHFVRSCNRSFVFGRIFPFSFLKEYTHTHTRNILSHWRVCFAVAFQCIELHVFARLYRPSVYSISGVHTCRQRLQRRRIQ